MKKLRYRGQPYSQSHQQIPTIDQPQTLCSQLSVIVYKYRGVSYVKEYYQSLVSCKTIDQPQTLCSQLRVIVYKYRGVSYVKHY